MSPPLANSWQSFYQLLADPVRTDQDNPRLYAELLKPTSSSDECRAALAVVTDVAALFITASGRIEFLHQFYWDRKNPVDPSSTDELWALLGAGDHPPPVRVPLDTAFADIAIRGPLFTAMSAALSVAAIQALPEAPIILPAADINDCLKYSGKRLVVLPPTLAAALLKSDNDNPAKACLEALAALNTADTFINA